MTDELKDIIIQYDIKYRKSGGDKTILKGCGYLISQLLNENGRKGKIWIDNLINEDRLLPSYFECLPNTPIEKTHRDIGFIIWNGYREYTGRSDLTKDDYDKIKDLPINQALTRDFQRIKAEKDNNDID